MLRAPFILAIIFFLFTSSSAQEIADYSTPIEYEIGGISVQGTKNADDELVRSISGLRKGMRIKIPGPKIAEGIKALWKRRLFSVVDITIDKRIGDVVFLKILVAEQPRLERYTLDGIKKIQEKELRERLDKILVKGSIVSESAGQNAIESIRRYYIEKGRGKPSVQIARKNTEGRVALKFTVHPGPRIKVSGIYFQGNDSISARTLRSQMTNTRSKKRILSSSKFIKTQYQLDKENIVAYYRQHGFRDARIVHDTVLAKGDGNLSIHLTIEEGEPYYFRNILWRGNSLYTDAQLGRALGIQKSHRYNAALLEERLHFSEKGTDISSLYLDRGHLFFRISVEEIAVEKDQIDLEIRIFEGPKAVIDKVLITGNDRTDEDVIRRVIRTRPGDQFSRAALIRSQREIINLGFFDPEKMSVQTPVNAARSTVDIEYQLKEKSSDQVELSAGFDPSAAGGLVGTLGFTFTNISLANLFGRGDDRTPWGGGQRLTLRAQSTGRLYQSYNFTFIEPWLGGKKPNALQLSGYYTRNADQSNLENTFSIAQASVGLAKQLSWPDDYFVSTTSLNLQQMHLNNFAGAFDTPTGVTIDNGLFNNYFLKQTIARNSISHPHFPTKGSLVSFSVQLTAPYSLLRGGNPDYTELPPARLYKYVEYHKWELNSTWYKQVADKWVLKASANWGLLGAYSKIIGSAPFQRFELGAEPLATGYSLTGKDPITLRGYGTEDFPAVGSSGAAMYQKLSLELRYRLNQSGSMYLLTFADAGNAWSSLSAYQPWDLKRSVGIGVRAKVPMLGTIGVDLGLGFDKQDLKTRPGFKWTDLLKASFILGFEPK